MDAIGCSERVAVIDIDHGRAARFHVRWKALFDGRVVFDASVPIDMIFGDVEKDSHGRPERRRKIDLIRRHFEHVGTTGPEQLKSENRHTDVSAHLCVASGAIEQMGDKGSGRRFSVGARDCDQRALATRFGALAAKQFDVTDNLHIGLACKGHRPMWLRMS